jgi:protein gp37
VADKTHIEWTDSTWNPILGCSPVSAGCAHCYAARLAARFGGPGNPLDGLAEHAPNGGARWIREPDGKPVIRFNYRTLALPLFWKKPRRVFVCSMSDLFHEEVPDDWIDKVFAVMALCPRHTFQVLTKRPRRMLDYFGIDRSDVNFRADQVGIEIENIGFICDDDAGNAHHRFPLPLQNVWLGVSIEDQETADERLPLLRQTPAALRFASAEPLLGPINVEPHLTRYCETDGVLLFSWRLGHEIGIEWLIVGGESGPWARPMELGWAADLIRQCGAAHAPCFVKQLGGFPNKRNKIEDWPEELRVRQYPKVSGLGENG